MTDAVWTLYERHPGLAEALRALDVMPRSGIRAFAEASSRRQSHGFSLECAVLAVDMLIDLTGDCALGWRALEQAEHQCPAGSGVRRIWQDTASEIPEFAQQINGMVAVMQDGARRMGAQAHIGSGWSGME